MDDNNSLSIDATVLESPVRKIVQSDSAVVETWQCTSLPRGASFRKVLRLRGTARDSTSTKPWEVILKRFYKGDGEPKPSQAFYWKREPLLYASGLITSISQGPLVPRCLGITSRSDDELWLWLESISDDCNRRWTLPDFQLAARNLGQFNAIPFVQNTVPKQQWLSREMLRRWLRNISLLPEYLNEFPEHAVIRRALPYHLRDHVVRLLPLVEQLLRSLRDLPQTFCHLDGHKRNFMLRESADADLQVILLDWALAGLGALGQDISPLVTVSAFMFEAENIVLKDLDGAVFDAYLEGMKNVGWSGDVRKIRLGYCADTVLRFLNRARFVSGFVKHEADRFWWEEVTGRPLTEGLDQFADMLPYMVDIADETVKLIECI